MSPSSEPDSPSSPVAVSQTAESHLQPFFVLHKALPRKPDRKSSSSRKTRRKADLSPVLPKPSHKSTPEHSKEEEDNLYQQLRIDAFDLVWSKIETTIKGVLKGINLNLFKDIHHFVCESFTKVKFSIRHGVSDASWSYPLASDNICKQIFTALIFTGNIEFVDDLLTFEELGLHLKSHGCHVANLSSFDFSVKSGIGGCLRKLLRQLVTVIPETADISILAAWYGELGNYDSPIVVIIDEIERCNSSVLAEFIMLLSEWTVKIPVILITGVATSVDAPTKVLPSNALQCLHPCKFRLGSPRERMDAIIENVLIKQCSGFTVGHEVAVFLRNYFLLHDGTITSFIRALKIACIKHFTLEPLSFLGVGEVDEDSEAFWREECESLPKKMVKHAFDLPSCQRGEFIENKGNNLVHGLLELKKLQKNWSSVVMCLYEVGKFHKVQLLDIFCEALDPKLHRLRTQDNILGGKEFVMSSSVDQRLFDVESSGLTKGSFISQAVRKVRDVPMASLSQLFNIWEKLTEEMPEINHKVQELQSALRLENGSRSLKHKGLNNDRSISRCSLSAEKGTLTVKENAAMLIECMIRDYLTPTESKPFHEIVCFKHFDVLRSALIGDPRRTIQVDLLKSHTFLQCSCCSKSAGVLLPSMHDTSIMYNLAQEHGDLINLHDWYQTFKATVLRSNAKGKCKIHQSPISKKRKAMNVPVDADEASIQARFCRAVTELQITGLLRMPSKRRPDYVQRVALGL